MRIGILSDSHKKTELHNEALEFLLSCDVEYIIHAGDIVLEEHIEAIKKCGLPFVIVAGNNDNHLLNHINIKQEPYYFKIQDIKFKLMHIPYYLTPDSDIIISGHTHKSLVEYVNGKLFLNSGEVCAREKYLSEVMVLDISDEVYEVNIYNREPSSKKWNSDIKRFERNMA
ncbi:hypothetical protein MNB_SV-15-1220 [hydrothermal vent metagenome]|uniref:Calcineurin-like phosphoesterase domain-containing protein n=1 Tax=hydrothermal vent metagenome TaxID=652676 RepID=A0A1W1ELE9_9ZZZZ